MAMLVPEKYVGDFIFIFLMIYFYDFFFLVGRGGGKKMFYLMMHSTHFIYNYMAYIFLGGLMGGCVGDGNM